MKTSNRTSRTRKFAYTTAALAWAAVAHAQFISLSVNSLPTNQSWTFVSAQLVETDVFVADGTSLTQTTVSAGVDADAYYQMDGIINLRDETTLALTVRVLAYERLANGSTGSGFNFTLRDEAGDYRLAMTDTEIIVNAQSMNLDTTVFHDYLLSMHPDGTFDLDVDGVPAFSGNSGTSFGTNRFTFGDTTQDENTDAELTSMRIEWVTRAEVDIDVQKTVNNAFPMASEPVEFTVEVSNIGGTVAADVVILDKLPPEMEIPTGTAAFVSVGVYDPETGEWSIGEMTVGGTATLTVPAVVTAAQTPECVVNRAISLVDDLREDDNDEAVAAVHGDSHIEHCVTRIVQFVDANPGSNTAVIAINIGCPPIPDVHENSYFHCDGDMSSVVQYLNRPDVDVVVIGAKWNNFFLTMRDSTYFSYHYLDEHGEKHMFKGGEGKTVS